MSLSDHSSPESFLEIQGDVSCDPTPPFSFQMFINFIVPSAVSHAFVLTGL